jgi:outer membrane protein OmpA-like peptidoglycan-associated protein
MILTISILVFTIGSIEGQSWLNSLGNKVKETAKSKVEQKVEEKTEKVLDKGFETVEGKNKKVAEENSEAAAEEKDPLNKENVKTDNSKGTQEKQKLSSVTQYDFVPGDKILFFEDFSQDAIGDFPALWNSNGSGEVKTVNIAHGKWFHMNGEDAVYCYNKTIDFPDNFIVEFDIIPDSEYRDGITLTLYQENPGDVKEMNDDLYPGLRGIHITPKKEGWQTKGYNNNGDNDWLNGNGEINPVIQEKENHVIVWVQKRRVRIYHEGKKVVDVPTNIYAETKFNKMRFSGWDAKSWPFISNIKITTASPDMRSKLLTEGRIISYGIYFDSGKDVVKGESYGSVSEIAKILSENPAVKIKIVGHTDSDGDNEMNLDLSKRRASNVKKYLVSEFKISADRIETDGQGENSPIITNTSVENKAKNRRVEFIKL